jgi:outer membrane protein assembly factor BamE (lipoprotein component of BamABCDE complex)
MKNLFIFLLIALFFSACTLKKINQHHGVQFLAKKQEKLTLNFTNKNDILNLLGPPSTKSTFDSNLWFYIERKITHSSLIALGKEEITVNNVLIVEIDNKGLLKSKEFLNLKNMKDLDFIKERSYTNYNDKTFIYDFLSSMRQKINDPLGKRKKK